MNNNEMPKTADSISPDTEMFSAEKNKIESSTLYLVATPIGNLADISRRAVKILSGVDFIAAEDTRVSAKLLSAYNIAKPLISYHEHNRRSCGEIILRRLQNGESCALITDAGTPAVSDPGEDIARLCMENNLHVTAVPGACAAICALTLSGMNTKRFAFEGFLDGNKNQKKEVLSSLRGDRRTLIFYEAPHNLRETLSLMLDTLGNRKIALCRELTKRNEEIVRCDITSAVTLYAEREPKGEFVLVVEGCGDDEAFWAEMTIPAHVEFYINSGMSKSDAMKAAAKDRGVAKNIIYKEML